MGFNPGKGNLGNQVFTWDGTKYIWQGPVVNYNAPAPGDWRRMLDRQANSRRAMSFDLVLKETSISGGLDVLKPRDICYFGGAGSLANTSSSKEKFNRLAILCQSASPSTVQFVESSLTGVIYNSGGLTGTASGWSWIMCAHDAVDTSGFSSSQHANYFFAYNTTDGNLVRFKDGFTFFGGTGVTVLDTLSVGTGGCKPIFDGTTLWGTGGGNLYRITGSGVYPNPGVFGSTGTLTVTTVDTGGYTSTGLMAMDIGGGIYVMRPGANQLVKVDTYSPYNLHYFDVSAFTPPANAGVACDGQNVWINTATGLAKFPTATMVNTATVDHPTLVPNGGMVCNGAMLLSVVPSSPTNNVIFTDLDATFTTALPAGGPQTSLQQAVTTSSITGCTDISYPIVVPNTHGVGEFYILSYNATANNNAQIRAFRYSADMAVNSLHFEGGLSTSETIITSATGSSPFQLHVDNFVTLVDLSGFGAGITLTLPPRPTRGCQLLIKDLSGAANTKNILINTSDSTQIDSASTTTINTAYGFRRLQYSPSQGSSGHWYIIGSG